MAGQEEERMSKAEQPGRARSSAGRRVIRYTYLMSPAIERNLAVYALNFGVTKQESITRALEKFLRDAGLDPTRVPTVSVTYTEGK
jgi:cobalamin biosynthesis protein CbiG